MIVADIMTPHVLTIDQHATVAEAIALMQYHHVRSLIIEPSNDHENHGIITERDIVYRVIARRLDPQQINVSEVMRSPCVLIFGDATIVEAAQRMAEAGIQRAPVIGFGEKQDGKLLGMISITDIVMKMNWVSVEGQPLDTHLQDALRHSRIIPEPNQQTAQESAIAWDVMEKYG
ncbi:MAG: CBS domain-containing protein [Okeania sp. SIO2B9]|nr:CBS domain-containing protein [Okeania sp. SIO2B9]